MRQAVRKNFEEKVFSIARAVTGMVVTEQNSFLSVDCGLPSDTVLQASKDGLGIYVKAGFRAIGDVHTFENRMHLFV